MLELLVVNEDKLEDKLNPVNKFALSFAVTVALEVNDIFVVNALLDNETEFRFATKEAPLFINVSFTVETDFNAADNGIAVVIPTLLLTKEFTTEDKLNPVNKFVLSTDTVLAAPDKDIFVVNTEPAVATTFKLEANVPPFVAKESDTLEIELADALKLIAVDKELISVADDTIPLESLIDVPIESDTTETALADADKLILDDKLELLFATVEAEPTILIPLDIEE